MFMFPFLNAGAAAMARTKLAPQLLLPLLLLLGAAGIQGQSSTPSTPLKSFAVPILDRNGQVVCGCFQDSTDLMCPPNSGIVKIPPLAACPNLLSVYVGRTRVHKTTW